MAQLEFSMKWTSFPKMIKLSNQYAEVEEDKILPNKGKNASLSWSLQRSTDLELETRRLSQSTWLAQA
jgi:hypothetical protein